MPEQELLRVDQRPVHVFPRLALVRLPLATWSSAALHLVLAGSARQRRQVQLVQDLRRRRLLRASSLPMRLVGVAQLLVDRRAVDELQGLGQVAVALRARTRRPARGPAGRTSSGTGGSPRRRAAARPACPAAGRRTSPARPSTSQSASSSCSAGQQLRDGVREVLVVVLVRSRSSGR